MSDMDIGILGGDSEICLFLAGLLDEASELYSNRGCNDLSPRLLKKLSPVAKQRLLKYINESSYSDPEWPFEKLEIIPDWCVLGFLAEAFKAQSLNIADMEWEMLDV
jgi:hypothetical protein